MEESIGFVFGTFITAIIFGLCISSKTEFKGKIIKDKGFCIETEASGVEFKKCYELKEVAQ